MSEKRRDNKGRVLKTGESQRKDGLYQFRYTDWTGKRQTIYASDLSVLREKEEDILKRKFRGKIRTISTSDTVADLVDRHVSLKRRLSRGGQRQYQYMKNLINKHQIAKMKISDVKTSTAKQFITELYDDGLGSETIKRAAGFLRGAFQLAVEDELLFMNPFSINCRALIPDTKNKRQALSPEDQRRWFEFLSGDRIYSRYYDINLVLLFTGIRVSELCGLTIRDVDLKNGYINIDHQLIKYGTDPLSICHPKSKSGVRKIPLYKEVVPVFEKLIEQAQHNRSGVEIDGYKDFIFFSSTGRPYSNIDIDKIFQRAQAKFNKLYPDSPIKVTPHVLRHTYSTNNARWGMEITSLSYLMGHASNSITLDVYTHTADFDQSMKEVRRLDRDVIDSDVLPTPVMV